MHESVWLTPKYFNFRKNVVALRRAARVRPDTNGKLENISWAIFATACSLALEPTSIFGIGYVHQRVWSTPKDSSFRRKALAPRRAGET